MRILMGCRAIFLSIVFATLPLGAQESHDHNQHGDKVHLLPREIEMKLAVNALPKSLRDGAAILVLESGGYQKAKAGNNPFTCIVSRRGGNFYPVCFDEEGTRAILPEYIDDAMMRLKGAPDEEIERQIAQRYADGKYRPPSRPGIAYMLSPANYMMSGGKLARNAPPHTMFYAPYLTDADIGGIAGRTAFVDRPGPHGMIIVLAGEKERETYAAESRELLEEVERLIGLR